MNRAITNSKFFIPASVMFITIVCIISRYPQLQSGHLLLDEDECVLGIMAKHMSEGRDISAFFLGQTYGFSLLEASLISLFALFLGFTVYTVKLAMLSLFIAGVIFFYKTLLSISPVNKWLALLVTCVLICSPAWAVWSMKARSGYLTAFFLSSVCTWLLFREERSHIITYLLLGILLAFIFYSQPLWLPGLVVLLLYKMLNNNRYTQLMNLAAGAIPVILILEWQKTKMSNIIWSPKVFELNTKHIGQLPSLLFHHLHGFYYLDNIYQPSFFAIAFAYLFIVLIVVLIAAAIILAIRKLRSHLLFVFLVTTVLVTLGYSLFLNQHAPRYLLPLTGYSLMAFFVYLSVVKSSMIRCITIIPFLFIGVGALYSFKDYSFNPYNKQQLQTCIQYLRDHNLRYVFANDALPEWQIIFYSQEQVICRESTGKDRYPVFVQQVNNAYREHKEQTAVVDFSGDLLDMAPGKAIRVADKFIIVPVPDEQLLKDMDVKF